MAYNRHLGQGGFRGVDFSSHPSLVSPDRFSNALNVWRDYHSGQGSAVETFPGYRQITEGSLGGEIFGIFRFRTQSGDFLIVHAGEKLYYKSLENVDENVNDNVISGAAMAARKSSAFQHGDSFYILDGTHYYKVGPTLTATEATDQYTPITYVNGEEYEQRNALSSHFKEKWFVDSRTVMNRESEGLIFTITDEDQRLCSIAGIGTKKAEVHVPAKATIRGQTYNVVSIEPYAFQNDNTIERLYVSDGIEQIGNYAFNTCLNLEKVFLPNSVTVIGKASFAYCEKLQTITLGAGVTEIPEYAFYHCSSFTVEYSGSDAQWNGDGAVEAQRVLIGDKNVDENEEPLFAAGGGATVKYNSEVYFFNLSRVFYLHEPCKEVVDIHLGDIKINEEGALCFETVIENEMVTSIILNSSNKDYREIIGKELILEGVATEAKSTGAKHDPFVTEGSTAKGAILGCTVSAQYDGRIFLTGNPAFPNTVFYSQRDLTGHNNPCYFGTYNFFNVGIGSSPNVAMISTGSNLIVLKNDTVQDGSINCYQGVDGSDDILPRIYVRTQGLPGIGCLGAACNFADDPVFVTTRGLDAVGTQMVNLERTVQHRSSNVDRRLLAENLSEATLTEWDGYLVLLTPSGHAYLADSRQVFTHSTGVTQYEWYYLDDIGHYEGDESVYRYSDFTTHETLLAKEDAQTVLTAKKNGVTSFEEDGSAYYYVEENGVRYAVVPTAEKTGGIFSTAVIAAGIGDLLFFGTADGHLLLVNTDKRGTLPTGALSAEIEAAEEYLSKYREAIPREWYSHAGHAYPSLVELAFENAGIPHMTKNTVRKTSVVKLKSLLGSQCKFNVRTNRENAYDQEEKVVTTMPDFGDNNLGATSFLTGDNGMIFNILEKKKKWVEKQYAFYSDEWCRPWGIYHVSYSYEIEGRVKNR